MRNRGERKSSTGEKEETGRRSGARTKGESMCEYDGETLDARLGVSHLNFFNLRCIMDENN